MIYLRDFHVNDSEADELRINISVSECYGSQNLLISKFIQKSKR